ncbi:MAG: hypothetical protein HC796_10615 [Synechococcaceae cyanobacterium RL_1_2]|nr:hypothetical protein [Synechococcaceae cyanobacterium RL_1_2]
MKPWATTFKTPDRRFAYIGVGEEDGQLILHNLTQQQKTILTTPDLVVTDFEFYPGGNKVLFSAFKTGELGLTENRLYSVELNENNLDESAKSLTLVLDNEEYQNLGFRLSPDGKRIVAQRLNRKDPGDFGLFLLSADGIIESLENASGGEFLITPDGNNLAVSQGQGIALLPLVPDSEPLEFLPKFGRILDFSQDGRKAAMVNFNQDNPELRDTTSLVVVNNQGGQQELFNTPGSIVRCDFTPTGSKLYCIITEVRVSNGEYLEQPFLAEVNLADQEVIKLLELENFQDTKLSISPDGLGLILDRIISTPETNTAGKMRTNAGETIIGSQIWLVLISPNASSKEVEPELQELPLMGIKPQWLP